MLDEGRRFHGREFRLVRWVTRLDSGRFLCRCCGSGFFRVGAEEAIEQAREISLDECVFPKLEWRFDRNEIGERH